MKKLTKRKGFNFLRSYFDVLNELQNDSDRVNFLMSIINKQFLGESPKDLNFIVNLCYESQRHQIESSVKGWERAANDTLGTALGTTPPTDPKELEEKGEEKEKEKWAGIENLKIEFCNVYPKAGNPFEILAAIQTLPKEEQTKAIEYVPTYVKNTEKTYYKTPINYLNSYCWNDKDNIKTKITYE